MDARSGNRWMAALLAIGISAGFVLPAAPAEASRKSEKTWRYLTYGSGGLTAYGLARGKSGLALLGAAGTAYSYSRWRRDVRNRHRHRPRHARHVRYYRHAYYR